MTGKAEVKKERKWCKVEIMSEMINFLRRLLLILLLVIVGIVLTKYVDNIFGLNLTPIASNVYGILLLVYILLDVLCIEQIKRLKTNLWKRITKQEGTKGVRKVKTADDLINQIKQEKYRVEGENGEIVNWGDSGQLYRLMRFYYDTYTQVKDDKSYVNEVVEIDKMSIELGKMLEKSIKSLGYITQGGQDIIKEFVDVMDDKIKKRKEKEEKENKEDVRNVEEQAKELLNQYRDICKDDAMNIFMNNKLRTVNEIIEEGIEELKKLRKNTK